MQIFEFYVETVWPLAPKDNSVYNNN